MKLTMTCMSKAILLHGQPNIASLADPSGMLSHVFIAPNCPNILSSPSRALMYEYEGENNPILASEGEERRLLRHLNKITRRADRTEEEDEICPEEEE